MTMICAKVFYGILVILIKFAFITCGWFDNTLNYLSCSVGRCCNPLYIPGNVAHLEINLKRNLYGQHIVLETVTSALKDHWQSGISQKALTLSFHGSPGIGKNYVANMIKESLYKDVAFIHHFNARIHFPLQRDVEKYQHNLRTWVRGNVSRCNRQLFIFDEVDKMPPAVLDAIKPMIDYNLFIDGVDYRETIFIFISNTGSKRINEEFLKLWSKGVKREELQLHHFEKLILEGAFNEIGGFQYSDNIKSNLIDHYIPFLPLEEYHVRLCIIDQFKKRGIKDVKKKDMDLILDVVDWGPESHKLFAKTGCKRLSQKVGTIASRYPEAYSKTEL